MSTPIAFPQWLCKCGVFYKTEIARDMCRDRGHSNIVKATVVIHRAMVKDAAENFDVSLYGIQRAGVGRKKKQKGVCETCGNPVYEETTIGRLSRYCITCKKTRLRNVEVEAKIREAKWREKAKKK